MTSASPSASTTSSGRSRSAKPSGASTSSSRCPGLMPSFLGSGVPEYPAIARPYADMRGEVIELISRLVAIDSVNPALVPGGAGEPEIARFVAEWAVRNGLAADWLEAVPGRPSVVVHKRERPGGPTLMLCAH